MVLSRLLKEKPGCQPSHRTLSLKSPAHKMCWGNGGTDCVRVAIQCLPSLEACTRRGKPCPVLPRWPGTRNRLVQRPREEPYISGYKKIINCFLMIFCYIRRVVSCTVVISEASSGRRWEQVQRSIVRHYSERKPRLEVFIGSLPVETGPVEEGEERVQVSEGMENIIITWHSESTKQALHGLTETEAAIIRHA